MIQYARVQPLFEHQERATEFLLKKGSGALFMEMGLGKTRIAIEYYRRRREIEPMLKCLVVCPLSLISSAWGEDITRFSSLTFLDCHEKGVPVKPISNKFWTIPDFLVINYEAFIQEKNYIRIQNLMGQFPFMCVLDESSRMKNHKSITTKKLLAINRKFDYRVIMSGTPAPNSEEEYWGQVNFIQPDLLHYSPHAFRSTYFHLEDRYGYEIPTGSYVTREFLSNFMRRGGQYVITEAKRQELMNRIAPYCYRATKAECLDLPEKIDIVREVEMGTLQLRAYKEMKRHLVAEINGQCITAQAALTKLMKLREITSGFAMDENGDSHDIGENPKLKELTDVLEEAGKQQAIIWCQFKHEIATIKNLLGKRAVTLYSETKNKDESISLFKNGHVQYLIAHPKSAAHGLTFVNASLEIFYSLDYSWESYEQAKGRTHRIGQVNKCTYVHLLCKNSVDQEIMKALKAKENGQEILFRIIPEFSGEVSA